MLSSVTALWAFGCSIFSPSINHLYCCGVSSFCGTSSSVIQSALKFDAYVFRQTEAGAYAPASLFCLETGIHFW